MNYEVNFNFMRKLRRVTMATDHCNIMVLKVNCILTSIASKLKLRLRTDRFYILKGQNGKKTSICKHYFSFYRVIKSLVRQFMDHKVFKAELQ